MMSLTTYIEDASYAYEPFSGVKISFFFLEILGLSAPVYQRTEYFEIHLSIFPNTGSLRHNDPFTNINIELCGKHK